MKRAELFLKIWRDCRGILEPGARIAIAGGGISGLHLAHALTELKFAVTVFEPQGTGGVRIPLMHACHTLKVRAPLWEQAAAYARSWYRIADRRDCAIEKSNAFGSYFIIRARVYLRHLATQLKKQGVEFRRQAYMGGETAADFSLTCIATGAATEILAATRTIPGWESYFSRHGARPSDAEIGKYGDKVTNYMHLPSRAGFIHRNGETSESAKFFAREIHPTGRHALFQGDRLTTRDRFPVVGFTGAIKTSPFVFAAMGYHAMTYAPYLAHQVALQWAGQASDDENLISTLTPTRFLPRTSDG